VALAVQFERLDALRTVDLGLIRELYRDRYPRCEEMPPLNPIVERFGSRAPIGSEVQIEVLSGPPMPRLWFLDSGGSGLIQVQPDRFAYNWRAREGEAYPRYPEVRERFLREFELFRGFMTRQLSAPVLPDMCEISYINIVTSGSGGYRPGQPGTVLTCFQQTYSDDYLAEPDSANLDLRYVIGGAAGAPGGRLHVSAKPVVSRADGEQKLLLEFVARGEPSGRTSDGVLDFFDFGREVIVRAFASLTTPEMHGMWGRNDVE
jgi:uncharacterized protein (TIGR04255 family)